MAEEHLPYFMRGLKDIPTQSSRLVSSSKYLNNPVIRDFVVQESLRKNGRDFPMTYALPQLFQALYSIRDEKRINEMLADQCKTKPELAAWFEEGYISTFTRQDLAKYAPNTCGGIYYHYLTANNFEIVLDPRIEMNPNWKPQSLLDYWDLRTGQTHDLDHMLGGGGYDFIGEASPFFMRIEGYFKFFDDPELAGAMSAMSIIMVLPMLMRTMLHYPETWPAISQQVSNGMNVGRQSEPWFLAKFEPLFDMSKEQARAHIGMIGVQDVDTWDASDVWSEGAQSAQLQLAAE